MQGQFSLPKNMVNNSNTLQYKVDCQAKKALKMQDVAEDIRYEEYLKRVGGLNQKKAFLTSYRHILSKEHKMEMIKNIQREELEIETEEKLMFTSKEFK
jgi:hypothetical protein